MDFIAEIDQKISESIPTASSMLGEVTKTIYDPRSSAQDLADIIERDPPITAKTIRVANSAYYGTSSRVNSLKRAIVILGFDTVKEIVTSIAMVHYFFDPKHKSEVNRVGMWLHSVGTAYAARMIAEKTGRERPDVAYTVGLLHDIGKIVMVIAFPDLYARAVRYAHKKKFHIVNAEHTLFNVDHSMVGNIICSKWKLPEAITDAISYHHNREAQTEHDNLVKIVRIADILTRKADIGDPGDWMVPDPDITDMDILGSSIRDRTNNFNDLLTQLCGAKNEINGFFSNMEHLDEHENGDTGS